MVAPAIALALVPLCGVPFEVPRLPEAPILDGHLDDGAWQELAALPLADGSGTVRIGHDGQAVWIGVACAEARYDDALEIGVHQSNGVAHVLEARISGEADPVPAWWADWLAVEDVGRYTLEARVWFGALGLGDEQSTVTGLSLTRTHSGKVTTPSGWLDSGPTPVQFLRLDQTRFHIRGRLRLTGQSASVGPSEATVTIENRTGRPLAGTLAVGDGTAQVRIGRGGAEDVTVPFTLTHAAREWLGAILTDLDDVVCHITEPIGVPVASIVRCEVILPSYRATIYPSVPVTEGLFRVVLDLPESLRGVSLSGRLVDGKGQASAPRTLEDAKSGTYDIDFALAGLEPGRLSFEVEVVTRGVVLDRATASVSIVPPGDPEVVVGPTGCLMFDGRPWLVIGVAARAEGDLSRFADAGFSLVYDESGAPPSDDVLASAGGRVLVACRRPSSADDFARLRRSRAVSLWIGDPADQAVYESLVRDDPYRPVAATAPTGSAHADTVLVPVDAADILGASAAVYGAGAASDWRQPVWCRVPLDADRPQREVAALTYACIVAGATGVVFDPLGRQPVEAAASVRQLLTELAAIVPVVTAPFAARGVSVSDERVVASTWTTPGETYVLAVNTSADDVRVTFSGLAVKAVREPFAGAEVEPEADGTFILDFEPYAARLLVLQLMGEPE